MHNKVPFIAFIIFFPPRLSLGKEVGGTVTLKQVYEIAKIKQQVI